MTAFPLQLVPDDVLAIVLESFLDAGDIRQLSLLDVAFCNRAIRTCFLDYLRTQSVSIDQTIKASGKSARDISSWIETRGMRISHVDITDSNVDIIRTSVDKDGLCEFVRSVSIHSICKKRSLSVCRLFWDKLASLSVQLEKLLIEFTAVYTPRSIPWVQVFGNADKPSCLTSLKLYDVNGDVSTSLVCPPNIITPTTTLTSLYIDVGNMDIVDLDRLLRLCPNLQDLYFKVNGDSSFAQLSANWMSEDPLLLHLRNLICIVNNQEVPFYLFMHAPRASTVVLGESKFLLPYLTTGRLCRLKTLQCRIDACAKLFLRATHKHILWSEEEPEVAEFEDDVYGEAYYNAHMVKFLQSLNREPLRECSVTLEKHRHVPPAVVQRFWKALAPVQQLTHVNLTHGVVVIRKKEDWIRLFQLPMLQELNVYDEGNAFHLLPSVCQYLQENKCAQSRVTRFACGTSESGMSEVVCTLMPRLQSFEWYSARSRVAPSMHDVAKLLVRLPYLEVLTIVSEFDRQRQRNVPVSPVNWEHADYACLRTPRPKSLVIYLTNVVPQSVGELKAMVRVLGAGLKRLVFTGVCVGDVLHGDELKDFLVANTHVRVVSGEEDEDEDAEYEDVESD